MLLSTIGMLARGFQFVLLLLIAGLLLSGECCIGCANLRGAPHSIPVHEGCPHHSHAPAQSQPTCHPHQASEFLSPEQPFQLTHTITSTLPVFRQLQSITVVDAPPRAGAAPPGTAPPPASAVLRI